MTPMEKLQQQILALFYESLKLNYSGRCAVAKDLKLWAKKLEHPKTTKKGVTH